MTYYRVVFNSVFLILLCAASPAYGAPIVYLSSDPIGVATPPDPADTLLVRPGETGTLNLFALPDVRMAEIRVNLANMGSAIEFTGANVLNSNDRWAFTADRIIQPQEIRSIGGGAIQGLSGNGIGPDSPNPGFDPTSGYLIATISFASTHNLGGASELFIKAERASDWEGNPLDMHFGGPNHALTPGYLTDATDSLLDFRIRVVPEPCAAALGGLAFLGLTAFAMQRRSRSSQHRCVAATAENVKCL